eukprot:CAMPEP_0172517376 /NCGR_PEP_ID=MMETSP1066-20121228/284665_1 /TAXON_ID=671091 /ORGANISM="Coscinodiscus wailesii, Strain CCMP2513" /LENGTH=415 /DNA_ID=CAMNT_0013299359 /DNA_START=277 /DNA_END=1524 /DNA_ORIENTATION=-
MDTDIERGLERRGGTVPVDDLITTKVGMCGMRVRDAVIVSKAWRDGASPRDVITAALLTRRSTHCFRIRRYRKQRFNGNESVTSWCSFSGSYWEEVRWVDDLDMALLKCPSLGPRAMRGFEMFTIGDCQSLLLKLTNERCLQLRAELNEATERQIAAEKVLNEDVIDIEIEGSRLEMTDAEITYLTAMEETKTLSKQLIIAENAFKSVRERIERLVQKYESLLIKMEVEEGSKSSAGSSFEGDDEGGEADSESGGYDSAENDEEKEMLARRAQRAELKAEVAAREAMLAKEEAERIRIEKQRELEELQNRLAELESKSMIERERSANLVSEYEKKLAMERNNSIDKSVTLTDGESSFFSKDVSQAKSLLRQSHNDANAKERLKAKFRSRRAERVKTGRDFYERSLQAVEYDGDQT